MKIQRIKCWLNEIGTVAFMTTVLSSIGYCAIYPGIFKVPIHELSNLPTHAVACFVILTIALSLAIVLVKVFGLSFGWKSHKEEKHDT